MEIAQALNPEPEAPQPKTPKALISSPLVLDPAFKTSGLQSPAVPDGLLRSSHDSNHYNASTTNDTNAKMIVARIELNVMIAMIAVVRIIMLTIKNSNNNSSNNNSLDSHSNGSNSMNRDRVALY